MKNLFLLIRFLVLIYLVICVSVHVYGLFAPISKTPEPVWSHIVHIISYSACLIAFMAKIKFRNFVYGAAMVYPCFYHARCVVYYLQNNHTLNGICLSVIIILPLGLLLLVTDKRPAI